MSYFPQMVRGCTFGYWEVFGRILDLKTNVAVWTGLLTGLLFVSWFLLSILITAFRRYTMYLEAKDAIRHRYGPGVPAGQRPLPADCKIEVVGDYVSAAILEKSTLLFPIGFRLWRWRVTITLREIVIFLRFLFWVYLVHETERMVDNNNLTDGNQWTYGQFTTLILLLIPVSGLWKICYRGMAGFRRFFDSYLGHNHLLYSFGGLLELIQLTAIWGILGVAPFFAFSYSLSIVSLGVSVIVETMWCNCSISFDQLLGNDLYPPASSFWQVWFFHHEIKIPVRETLPHTTTADFGVQGATELEDLRREVIDSPVDDQDAASVLPAQNPMDGNDQTSNGVDRDGFGASGMRLTGRLQESNEFRRSRTT